MKLYITLFALVALLTFERFEQLAINQMSEYYASYIIRQQSMKLFQLLKFYDTFDLNNQKIKLIRHGQDHDGGYVLPEIAFLKADVLMGYGIAEDISFEDQFSLKYNKPSFAFDCSSEKKKLKINSKLTQFNKECIGNDRHLYNEQKSTNVASYSQQIHKLKLHKNKVFLKMDIEGTEYDNIFHSILMHKNNITGILIEIHDIYNQIEKAIKLLSDLNKDFYLVHLHGNNYANSCTLEGMPCVIELSYINKNLVSKAYVAKNQKVPNELDQPNNPSVEDSTFAVN